MRKTILLTCALMFILIPAMACGIDLSRSASHETELSPLPSPTPDGGPFGVDANINMSTIDNFLGRPDVVYIDIRMFYDPADFPAIGGEPNLTQTLPGFRIVPFPYMATIPEMPVEGGYVGDSLFTVEWGEYRNIISYSPNFAESKMILRDLFPQDEIIFLMCGGAGYSANMRTLLVHMGWNEQKIYHVGGNWHYQGDRAIDLTIEGNREHIATWRANYAFIDFSRLTRLV